MICLGMGRVRKPFLDYKSSELSFIPASVPSGEIPVLWILCSLSSCQRYKVYTYHSRNLTYNQLSPYSTLGFTSTHSEQLAGIFSQSLSPTPSVPRSQQCTPSTVTNGHQRPLEVEMLFYGRNVSARVGFSRKQMLRWT